MAVFVTVHRHGRGNPMGTGQLSRQIGKLFAEVQRLKTSQGNAATKAELGVLAGEVRALEARAATSMEVIALEGKVNTLRATLEGQLNTVSAQVSDLKESSEVTRKGVEVIQNILMKGALDR
ncbi:hypothetical protein TS85_17195 [Sphingomonas hengshuiensis]|uniref:Uncharacterized protein n=1 Tax=Sphingomonas hengshuiensis TaxID=1609977 RepID=A0A7U4JAC1_9SPHN|nr:hypothetical protein TS85_17195 [Sphingomonas hengshuiensis]